MREGTAHLVRREDYAAPAYWIRAVDLTFELDPVKTLVINRMQIERNADQPQQPLRLDGEDITVTRVLVNGDSVSFRTEDGQLVIDTLPDTPFSLEIRNICRPTRTPNCRGCTSPAEDSSRSAKPRAFAASPTSSTALT